VVVVTTGQAARTRARVLSAARELFYWQGIRATGIDTVAAAAQVATPTLYRMFGSKDGLVAAYLEHDAEGYLAWLTAASAPAAGSARERILAIFDALAEQVRPEYCRGCPFLMALAEYPDEQSRPHVIAVTTKAAVRRHFETLTGKLADGPEPFDPGQLADQLTLVMEGVYASVAALGVDGPVASARSVVESLLDAAAR
jgi:AcrR family transcriptional regulator